MLAVPFLADLIRATLRGTAFPHMERGVSLLLGVAATESGLQNIPQTGGGPARGVFQMEPYPTGEEMHAAVIAHAALAPLLEERCQVTAFDVPALEESLVYQIVLARMVFYVRDPLPLPGVMEIAEQGRRYKEFYNTPAGAGSVEKYIADYRRLIAPYYPASIRR